LKSRTLAYIELFVAAVTWSSLFLFLKELEAAGLSPGGIISARMVLSSVIIALIVFPLKLKFPSIKHVPLLMVPGICFFLGAVLIATGEESQSPGITAFIGFLIPIIISLFLLEKLNIKLTKIGFTALFIAIGGLVLTGLGDQIKFNSSLLIIFVGACFVGIYFVSQKFLVSKHGPYVVTSYTMWAALPLSFLYMPSFISHIPAMSGTAWVMLFGVTIFATLIPFFLYTHAMKELGPAEGTAVNLLIPFFGSLLAWEIVGFELTTLTLIGGIITLTGVCVYIFKGIVRKDEVKI
jgi:drug/metabolite transporter (DMT)-like permease